MDRTTEAAGLQADLQCAEGELTALRREMDERVDAGGGHIDVVAATEYRTRLEALQGRIHELRVKLRDVDRT